MLCVGVCSRVVCAEAVVRCSAGVRRWGRYDDAADYDTSNSKRGEEGRCDAEHRRSDATRKIGVRKQSLPGCDKLFVVGMWSCGCGVAFHTPDVSCLFLVQGSGQVLRQKEAQWLHTNVNGG